MRTNVRNAAIWVIAFFLASAQRSTNALADLLILNGKVYTADGSGTFQEAVAVGGNRALRSGRLAGLGATPDSHHGLPGTTCTVLLKADTTYDTVRL